MNVGFILAAAELILRGFRGLKDLISSLKSKKCINCAESVKKEALVCKHCGNSPDLYPPIVGLSRSAVSRSPVSRRKE